MTVLLSLDVGSVSTRVVGAGFGPMVGNYLCDTQACAPSCPGEQSPWSDENSPLHCARLWTEAAQPGLWSRRQLSPQHSGHPVLGAVLKQGVPPTIPFHCPLSAWPFWACTEGLGWSNGASTVWNGIFSKLIEVNSRLMLVGFMLWPPKERQLQFLVFLVFPGLNQHKSLPQRTRGNGSPRR